MRYFIFGTGVYYQTFKKYLQKDEIICLLDNDDVKKGTTIDGIEIKSPYDVNYDQCDFVLVLIMRYSSVYEQLRGIGVPECKIKSFYDMGKMFDIEPDVHRGDKLVGLSHWGRKSEKNVLLVAHELTRNGVSVVLMHLSMLLKEMGYNVMMAGLIGGGLEEELQSTGIDYIPHLSVCYKSDKFKEFVSKLDFMVVGAVGSADVVNSLADTDVPILWWMHESNDQNFIDFSIMERHNIHYYAGGTRVVKKFKEFYPSRHIEKLLYFLPDDYLVMGHEEPIRIAVIGALNYRKAQDIFVDAVRKIPKDEKKNISFDLVGTVVEPVIDVQKVVSENPEISYLGELTQEELKKYFSSLDILVCCSRDDPMPVVVTQAMQYGIACVVSDQVGQSDYITNGENGYVFKSEDVHELTEILRSILREQKIRELGEKSKIIYKEYFSAAAMRTNMERIIHNITER